MFVVSAQAARVAEQGEGALDDPAPWQDMKTCLEAYRVQKLGEVALNVSSPWIDHFQLDTQVLPYQLAQRAPFSYTFLESVG